MFKFARIKCVAVHSPTKGNKKERKKFSIDFGIALNGISNEYRLGWWLKVSYVGG